MERWGLFERQVARGGNASAATVQSALEALSNIGVGDVSVTKSTDTSMGQTWDVTFAGTLADTNVSQITINSSGVSVMGTKFDVQQTLVVGGVITYEVQTTSMTNANGGTYTLSFQGQTTSALDWNASAATIDTSLEAVSTIDTVNVSGSSGCFSITFTGTHSGQNVPQLTGDASNLENHQNRVLSFDYDAADQLTAAEDPAASYAYVYDNLGRVTQQTQDLAGLTPNVVLNQAFDAASNRTEISATIGANADFKNTYAYDNLNRMTQVIQQSQSGGNAVAPKRIDFAYNAAGQFTQIDRYQSTGTSNNVAQTFFGYDGIGGLKDLDHKQGTTVLAAYDYAYDAASRITSIVSSAEGTSTFTYDVTNQLTAADHTSQPDENYSFDLNGNRTGTGIAVADNNRTTSDGTYNYEYDNEGNRTKRAKLSDGSYEEYQWDHRNRLTNVTFKNSSGTVQKTVEHSYDVFNRWVRKTTDPDGAGAGAATDQFFAYDGYNPVLQFDGNSDTDLAHRNLFGPEVDQILAIEDVSSLTQAGNPLWALSDHLGTPRDVADLNEGTGTTTVTNHRTYNSFGKRISESNSLVDFAPGFTGKLYDEDTGAGNHLNRLYDAALMQWLSEDPKSFGAGDTNLRRYVHNSATNFIDPDGREEKKPGGGVNLHKIPPDVLDSLVEDGLAKRIKSEHGEAIVVDLPTADGIKHFVYVLKVKIREELTARKKETFYQLVGVFSQGVPCKNAAEVAVLDRLEIEAQAEYTALLTFILHMLPGGATADYISEGEYGNALLSGLSDVALIAIPGGQALKVGPKTMLVLKGITIGAEGTLAVVRGTEAAIEVYNGDLEGASGPAGEALARLIAAVVAAKYKIKVKVNVEESVTTTTTVITEAKTTTTVCDRATPTPHPDTHSIRVPDKNGRMVKRRVRMTIEDEKLYGAAQGERYDQLIKEPVPPGLTDEQVRAWRFQRMNEFRRQWLDDFYKRRKY
jgi:RHS repeat-associated protein